MRMSAEVRKAIGAALRDARLGQQKTQEEVAGEVGLSRQMINRYEKGRDAPKAENLAKLLRYFGSSLPLPGYNYALKAEAFEGLAEPPKLTAEQLTLELGKPSELFNAHVRIFPKKTSIEIVISKFAVGE